MHYARLGHQSTLLSDGRVLITGGATALEPESKDQYPGISAEIYDVVIQGAILNATD